MPLVIAIDGPAASGKAPSRGNSPPITACPSRYGAAVPGGRLRPAPGRPVPGRSLRGHPGGGIPRRTEPDRFPPAGPSHGGGRLADLLGSRSSCRPPGLATPVRRRSGGRCPGRSRHRHRRLPGGQREAVHHSLGPGTRPPPPPGTGRTGRGPRASKASWRTSRPAMPVTRRAAPPRCAWPTMPSGSTPPSSMRRPLSPKPARSSREPAPRSVDPLERVPYCGAAAPHRGGRERVAQLVEQRTFNL